MLLTSPSAKASPVARLMRMVFAVGGHAAVGNARIASQHQHLVGGSVVRRVRPGLHPFVGRLAVGIGDVAFLRDGVDAALREEIRVDGVAGADAVRLSGGGTDDAGIGRAVDAGQMVPSFGGSQKFATNLPAVTTVRCEPRSLRAGTAPAAGRS